MNKSSEFIGNIKDLLGSDKEPDVVESESTKLISEQLRQEAIRELDNELLEEDKEIYDNLLPQEKTIDLSPEKISQRLDLLLQEIQQKPDFNFLRQILDKFPQGEIYLTGGAVRDALLERKNKDYDIIIRNISPKDLESYLSSIGETKLIGRAFGVYQCRPFENETNEFIEIALPRTEWATGRGGNRDFKVEIDHTLPIEDDLSRRDFTITAFALNIASGEFIDEFSGLDDLKNGIIRAINDPEKRFEESNIRVMRGLRFATKLNFEIEENTWQAMKKFAPKLTEIDENDEKITATELIKDEMLKTFFAQPVRALDLYKRSGLLKIILPEVETLDEVAQSPEFHPEGDVYTHTRLALKTLPYESPISLIMATLFHDIGKTITQQKTIEEGKVKIRFPSHEQVGAELAEKACKRLRFSNDLTKEVVWLVKNHMKPMQLKNMKATTIEKLLFNELSKNLLKIHRADVLASNRDFTDYDEAKRVINKMREEKKARPPLPFINGDDVIAQGYAPGPEIKEILHDTRELQLNGEVNSREQALEWLESKKSR